MRLGQPRHGDRAVRQVREPARDAISAAGLGCDRAAPVRIPSRTAYVDLGRRIVTAATANAVQAVASATDYLGLTAEQRYDIVSQHFPTWLVTEPIEFPAHHPTYGWGSAGLGVVQACRRGTPALVLTTRATAVRLLGIAALPGSVTGRRTHPGSCGHPRFGTDCLMSRRAHHAYVTRIRAIPDGDATHAGSQAFNP